MAENKGKTKGAMMAAVKSAQMAVGSALAGGQGAVGGGGGDSPQLVMLLEDLRDIGRENEKNTQSVFSILKSMFVFDKDAARRLRDQMAEKDKEKKGEPAPSVVQDVKAGKEKFGMPKMLMLGAGLTALAAFMKGINLDSILRLPQQIKSIKAIGTFVAGITKLGTLGLGARFIDKATDSLKLFKTNFIARVDDLKLLAKNKFSAIKFPTFAGIGAYIDDLDFVKYIKNSKGYKGAVTALKGIKTGLVGVMTPIKNAFQAVFGGAAAGPAGAAKSSGAIGKILSPLKAIGRMLGKIFLPLTLILAVFDGYKGFMEEWEKEQNFVDGIRGAVTGIVDGFVGGLITLVTDVVGWMLDKLGLAHMANVVREFGDNVRACLKLAVGGLVDIVTGIFTFDGKRILEGLKNLTGGVANFMFETITWPINSAIALVSDIFKWGDPENPFTVRGFLFGDAKTGQKGVVNEAVEWFQNLFSLDGLKEKYDNLKAGVMDFGKRAKATIAASAAFIKAGFPGGESPTEAYKRVFDSIMNSGGDGTAADTSDQNEIVKTTATDVQGNTTETTYKTNTVNEGATTSGAPVIIQDSSVKQSIAPVSNRFETYTGQLNTSSDVSSNWSNSNRPVTMKKSDKKLKEDIKLEGKSPSGTNIYSFKYKGEEGRYKGVMAQETLKAAIFNIPGYLMVDYNKLDVEFAKIA